MDLQALQAELRRIERRKEKLEKEYEARKATQFTALPARVGLKSVDALIVSLAPYASPRLRSRIGANGGTAAAASTSRRRGRRRGRPPGRGGLVIGRRRGRPAKRGRPSRYPAEIQNAIRAGLEKGETSASLGKKHGVSPYTIKDWKKRWGLAKPRKRK